MRYFFKQDDPEYAFLQKDLECVIGEVLLEAVRDHSAPRWCGEVGGFVEGGSGDCGRDCKFYAPRNGKSGLCCYSVPSFKQSGRKFEVTRLGEFNRPVRLKLIYGEK